MASWGTRCVLWPVHTGDYSRRFRRQFVAENGDCCRIRRLASVDRPLVCPDCELSEKRRGRVAPGATRGLGLGRDVPLPTQGGIFSNKRYRVLCILLRRTILVAILHRGGLVDPHGSWKCKTHGGWKFSRGSTSTPQRPSTRVPWVCLCLAWSKTQNTTL